jgi:hypothetical protein
MRLNPVLSGLLKVFPQRNRFPGQAGVAFQRTHRAQELRLGHSFILIRNDFV